MLTQKHNGGFHLIEIAIVLAVLGLLATVSFPSLRLFSYRHALRSEIRKFAALLEGLSLESLQRETVIEVELSGGQYFIARPGRQDRGSFANPVAVAFKSTNLSHLSFFPSGAATPGTITFNSGDLTCNLTLSLRGRVAYDCP